MVIRAGRLVRRRRHRVGGAATLGAVAVLSIVMLVFTSGAVAAEASVNLGTTASYAVLAGSTVTNTGPTTVSGDLGLSPGSSVTGFPPGLVSGGVQNVANAAAVQAQSDLVIAYNDAAGRTPATAVVGDSLGGLTLTAGLYGGGALDLTGTLTLDAQGDTAAVFIFQAASTLITASASQVKLVNGASPCNVFWQVGSSATLGTATSFNGTILALTSITLNTGATVAGRLLARNGAVTLDSNTINSLDCSPSSGSPDDLIDNLHDIIDSVDVTNHGGQKLNIRLNSVERYLAAGNVRRACGELAFFVTQVDNFLAKGWVSAADAARLRAGALALSLSLNCAQIS